LLVISPNQEAVDVLTGILRRGGLATHCIWLADLQQLPRLLTDSAAELLLCISPEGSELAQIMTLLRANGRDVPVIMVRPSLTETDLASDLALGARDSVTFASPPRLQAVITRELRSKRLDAALRDTLRDARESRDHIVLPGTSPAAAVARIQDGVLVDANSAWLELLGLTRPETVVGQPALDSFDELTQPTLKKALIACMQGKPGGEPLTVEALRGDGSSQPIEVLLSVGQWEGARCINITVPTADGHTVPGPGAAQTDALPQRAALLSAFEARIQVKLQGGSRYLLCIRPDNFPSLERQLGVLASDQLLHAIVEQASALAMPNDIIGHYSSTGLMALIERGNERDAKAWAEKLRDRVAALPLQGKAGTLTNSANATLTIGMVLISATCHHAETIFIDALEAARRGRLNGGNQLFFMERSHGGDTRAVSFDAQWTRLIRAALTDNRFRLVQQPVASLQVVDTHMFDLLLRLVDEQGKEILPGEFLPAAQRNDLMRHIDRWVLTAALELAARRSPACLFVRLSVDSALDPTLLMWLDSQLRNSHVSAQRLCIQIPEDIATAHLPQITQLANELRDRRVRFALEHFGVGADPLKLINAMPLDFIKLDGSLMQGLVIDTAQQQRVRKLVEAAGNHGIATIAERIEDANTMAALWQLGVEYLQGHLIQLHEEIVLEAG
jgi:EAL domain-containing protein (putative c-di-GMP-specific phosphodiesterase class I)/GGDEF domain-containing protein/CheY-like chemotaxis protein